MRTKELKSSLKLPTVGYGTWRIGGGREIDKSRDKEGILAIKKAIKLGYTHIDTAESYGLGHSEELVGKAIKEFNRKELFITTKVSSSHLRYDDLLRSAKASLKRLGTDYVDLYLVHAPNPDIPISETMKAMDKLVEDGLIKNIGVSNFNVKQLKEAQKKTKNKIVANQIEYNLVVRNHGKFMEDMEKKVIPYCQKKGIFVIAWRPLLYGMLGRKGFPMIDKLSKKYEKTRAQIALNWLISKKNVITIPMTLSEDHMKENLESADFEMKKEDIKKLDKMNT